MNNLRTSKFWLEYFDNEFLPILSNMNTLRIDIFNQPTKLENVLFTKEVCDSYVKLFKTSCRLIEYFLKYNGIFQYDDKELIKEAFYIELIEEGQKWIDIQIVCNNYRCKGFDSSYKDILYLLPDEYFRIFEDLKNMLFEYYKKIKAEES